MATQSPESINAIRLLIRTMPEEGRPLMEKCLRSAHTGLNRERICRLVFINGGLGRFVRSNGEAPLELRAGDLVYFHNEAPRLDLVARDGLSLYVVDFSFTPLRPGESWTLREKMSRPDRLRVLFESLYDIRELQNHPLESHLAGSLIHAVLGELYEEIKHPWEQQEPAVRKVREVCLFIEVNPTRRLSLRELSARVDLSPSYLGHRFKEVVGISPYKYQLQVRMAHARRLLREDRLTVARTAEVCGYANPYVFSKVFKEVTGVSPGKV